MSATHAKGCNASLNLPTVLQPVSMCHCSAATERQSRRAGAGLPATSEIPHLPAHGLWQTNSAPVALKQPQQQLPQQTQQAPLRGLTRMSSHHLSPQQQPLQPRRCSPRRYPLQQERHPPQQQLGGDSTGTSPGSYFTMLGPESDRLRPTGGSAPLHWGPASASAPALAPVPLPASSSRASSVHTQELEVLLETLSLGTSRQRPGGGGPPGGGTSGSSSTTHQRAPSSPPPPPSPRPASNPPPPPGPADDNVFPSPGLPLLRQGSGSRPAVPEGRPGSPSHRCRPASPAALCAASSISPTRPARWHAAAWQPCHELP